MNVSLCQPCHHVILNFAHHASFRMVIESFRCEYPEEVETSHPLLQRRSDRWNSLLLAPVTLANAIANRHHDKNVMDGIPLEELFKIPEKMLDAIFRGEDEKRTPLASSIDGDVSSQGVCRVVGRKSGPAG